MFSFYKELKLLTQSAKGHGDATILLEGNKGEWFVNQLTVINEVAVVTTVDNKNECPEEAYDPFLTMQVVPEGDVKLDGVSVEFEFVDCK